MASKRERDNAYNRMFGAGNPYEQIPIVYPVVIKYKNGSIDRFYENGVREFIENNSQLRGSTSFSRTKETKPRDEYEFFIRRLMYVSHGVGSQEDWDKAVEEANRVQEKVMSLSLNEDYNGNKLFEDEQPGQVQQVENKGNPAREIGGSDSGIKIYSGEEDPF